MPVYPVQILLHPGFKNLSPVEECEIGAGNGSVAARPACQIVVGWGGWGAKWSDQRSLSVHAETLVVRRPRPGESPLPVN